MIQSVVGFFRNLFSPILSNDWNSQTKRLRDDEVLDLEDDNPPVKKRRMNVQIEDSSDSSYFSNLFYRKTKKDKFSQTVEVIDLEDTPAPPVIPTISLLDETYSVSDKENVVTQIPSSKNKSHYKSFKAPSHCRSPHKTKFKNVVHRRGSDDVRFVASYPSQSAQTMVSTSGGSYSKRHLFNGLGTSSKKQISSRTEHIMGLVSRNSNSVISPTVFDIQSRLRYGELLGKVLKSPEMFSCRAHKPSSAFTSTKIIDLTEDEPTSSKSHSKTQDGVHKRIHKSPDAVVDLTVPSSKPKIMEIIDLDQDTDVIPVAAVSPQRRIVSPVNSLTTKLKHVPCTSDSYISSMIAEIESLRKDFTRDKEQVGLELSALSPLRKPYEKALEERIRRHLKITSIDIDLEDEEEEEPAKPQLSDQMMGKVINAWDLKKPRGQVLVNNFNYQIKRIDLLTLSGLNWLNDEVINFYMELISARGKQKDFPSVHTFSTFFYLKLENDGHPGLRRWTRKVDIFSFDLIIVPIHLSVHWCLAVIDLKKKTISYFDSMGQANKTCVNSLLQYLSDEHMDKKKIPFDKSDWELICTRDKVPQQMNSCDCGVFACTFAEYSARKANFNFSQEDMPYFRRKMTYEILSSELLQWN